MNNETVSQCCNGSIHKDTKLCLCCFQECTPVKKENNELTTMEALQAILIELVVLGIIASLLHW